MDAGRSGRRAGAREGITSASVPVGADSPGVPFSILTPPGGVGLVLVWHGAEGTRMREVEKDGGGRSAQAPVEGFS